jgi:hypothetical protein
MSWMFFFKWGDAKIIKDGLLQMGKTNGKLGTPISERLYE